MKGAIQLPWTAFKEQVLNSGYFQWLYFDVSEHYFIYAKQNDFNILCKIFKGEASADLTDFEENFKPNYKPILKGKVVTALEENDKVLKLGCATADFNESGDAVVEIKVPGEFNGLDSDLSNGRFVAGGYGFVDNYKLGDRCSKVEVVDKDNVLGLGANTVIKAYHDTDMDEPNQGWLLYAALQNQGEVEIDPMGGYGFLPSGLYLRISFKRAEGGTATKVAVDIWWGKRE